MCKVFVCLFFFLIFLNFLQILLSLRYLPLLKKCYNPRQKLVNVRQMQPGL